MITKLIFRVDYSGYWAGARTADDGVSITSWSGTGTTSVTVDRPCNDTSDITSFWIVTASAVPNYGGPLTLSILFPNGTVAAQAIGYTRYDIIPYEYLTANVSYTLVNTMKCIVGADAPI